LPGEEADVVIAAAGEVPTLEALAAVQLLHQHVPGLKMRFVNVVDLMRLQDEAEHPHGMSHADFDAVFTTDKPVVFAFHGYPALVHQLTYRRHNHANIHVRGFKEAGTTTTPHDMLMLNDLDRHQLAIDVIRRVPGLERRFEGVVKQFADERVALRAYAYEHGTDDPRVEGWEWMPASS
jgi:xylulose-5-phosphate/fructose-6-phosphate phosphoketolase